MDYTTAVRNNTNDIGNYKDDLPLEQISNTTETNGELSEEVEHGYSGFNYISTDEANFLILSYNRPYDILSHAINSNIANYGMAA